MTPSLWGQGEQECVWAGLLRAGLKAAASLPGIVGGEGCTWGAAVGVGAEGGPRGRGGGEGGTCRGAGGGRAEGELGPRAQQGRVPLSRASPP